MERIEDFVDERQKTWCIHCGRTLAGLKTNKDHVPTKSLLAKPRPHHLPAVTICRKCNNGFSRDEQYVVTFLSCVLSGTTDPEKQRNQSAARALASSKALRTMIERAKVEESTPSGEMRIVWQPDLDRIRLVILKNARGHAYFEYGEPMLEPPNHVWAVPLENMSDSERANFECLGGSLAIWPEVGSRMLTRVVTGQDMVDGWVVVQEGTY